MAGSAGAAIPGVVPGSCPAVIVAAAPAAHSASRLPSPKQPNAPGRGQRLQRGYRQRGAAGEVLQAGVRLPGHDGGGRGGAQVPHVGQAEPDGRLGGGTEVKNLG
jgi:hypothetical protein